MLVSKKSKLPNRLTFTRRRHNQGPTALHVKTFTTSKSSKTTIFKSKPKVNHNTPIHQQKLLSPTTTCIIPSRFISINDISKPSIGQLQQNFDPTTLSLSTPNNSPDFQSMLQAEVDENVSHGLIDFSRGRVVFDARSSLHNYVRYRVVEHRSSDLTTKEIAQLQSSLQQQSLQYNPSSSTTTTTPSNNTDSTHNANTTLSHKAQNHTLYYSFQEIYDDGDEEHEDPYVNLKTVIKAGSDNVHTLHLPSTCALINGLAFNAYSPQKVLYVGNWGGIVPHYISTRIGADVEILDPDAMSQYMSKTYSPGIFYENYAQSTIVTQARPRIGFTKEHSEHPFDIIFQYKSTLLNRYKNQKRLRLGQNRNHQSEDNNSTDLTMVELNQQEIDAVLNQDIDHDGNLTPLSQINPDQTRASMNSALILDLNATQQEQEEAEMDRAHAQLALQTAIISFQTERLRGTNTGKVSIHPTAIDTYSHLASLYSDHYSKKSPTIPTAIHYLQHQRHFKHLTDQYEQTSLNIKAMILEKFDLKALLLANPDSQYSKIKDQFDLFNTELVELYQTLWAVIEGENLLGETGQDFDDIVNLQDFTNVDPTTQTNELQSAIKKYAKRLRQMKLHRQMKQERDEIDQYNSKSPNNPPSKQRREPTYNQKVQHLKEEILSKKASLQGLASILQQYEPSQDELQRMSDLIIKWTQKRLNAIQSFGNSDVELIGGDDNNDDENNSSNVNMLSDDESSKNPSTQTNSINSMIKKRVGFTESLVDIFDEDEFAYAQQFNSQFVRLMIHGQDLINSDNEGGGLDLEQFLNHGNNDNHRDTTTANNIQRTTPFDHYDDLPETVLNPKDVSPQNTKRIYQHFLENQSMDGIWFQTSFFTLDRYTQSIKSHRITMDTLELKMKQLNVPKETLHILATIHENILDSVFLPIKGYDTIIHDHSNDPLTIETLRFIKEALVIEGDDDQVRHGVFIKRSNIANPSTVSHQFEGIQNWLPNIDMELKHMKQVFKHVYFQQPSHDSIIFIGTDGALGSDLQSAHPLSTDTIVDVSVALWQSSAVGLDVVEASDKWHYITKDITCLADKLNYDPQAFFHGDEDIEM